MCQIRTYLTAYILQSLLSVCVCVCVGVVFWIVKKEGIILGFGGGDGLRGFLFLPFFLSPLVSFE